MKRILVLAAIAVSAEARAVDWTVTLQASNTTNGLIAVSPVTSRVVWASGRSGTFVRTTDGGDTWQAGVVPGAEALQFRDVQGVSALTAYLLSIGGSADAFRIYKTTDGGATWTIEFQNQDPSAFFDGFAFWSPRRGLAISDSVNGAWPLLRTTDGQHFTNIGANMPPPLQDAAGDYEAGFAASGTLIATQGERNAWIGMGGVPPSARIFATRDGGNHWDATVTPLRGSPSAGIFSVAFRDARHGVIAGGDLDPTAPPFHNVARTRDGGRSWAVTTDAPAVGTIFCAAYAIETNDDDDDNGRANLVVTGPAGSAWSPDEGDTWNVFPDLSGYWGCGFADRANGWLVGTHGEIAKITFSRARGD